jgi:hypothetical protein
MEKLKAECTKLKADRLCLVMASYLAVIWVVLTYLGWLPN